LQKLTTEHIQEFYKEKARTHSSSVVAILHRIINGSLKQAVKQRVILNNPAEYTGRPQVKYRKVLPLTKEEVSKFLQAARNDCLYTAYLLDLFTSLREEIRVHTLRHTFGDTMMQAEENPRNVQALMGHADIRTTLGTHCHSGLEDKRRAVEKVVLPVEGGPKKATTTTDHQFSLWSKLWSTAFCGQPPHPGGLD